MQLSPATCYGSRLRPELRGQPIPVTVSNRKCDFCLEHFSSKLFFLFAAAVFSGGSPCFAQTATGGAKANLPPQDEIWYGAVHQDSQSDWKYLKGGAAVRTSQMTISADEIDFNTDTDWAYARGHVRLEHFATGDILNADHAEYNIRTEEGKFYAVNGTAPAKIMTSPGVLTTTNPFYFQALWAERIKNRYVLHKGYVTDCKIPKPWWTFQAPKFDIIPGQHAIARNAIFTLKHVPVLYLPYFFRPLGKNTRQSGFLTPNFGHTSTRGYMYGGGYYWAINRSYDLDYVLQYFTLRGPAHTFDFRGKPNSVSDFNFNFYAVQDKGVPGDTSVKQGGEEFEITGRTEIWGFTGKIDYNYLSSLIFRAAFSGTYNSAFSSLVTSIGSLQRHFDDDIYTLNFVFTRDQVYESYSDPKQQVVLQKLPMVETSGRDQNLTDGAVPVWFSFGASGGLISRQEPGFQTGWGTARIDLEPRVSTAFSFKGFSLNPSITLGAADYSKSYSQNIEQYTPVLQPPLGPGCGGYPSCPPQATSTVVVSPTNQFRKDADFVLDLRMPSLERIFTPPAWMHMGAKLKHVVEAEATYEYVTGINEFQRIIHFDETDIISNTNQLTASITNRLYKKDKKGQVQEILTWRVAQARYFDPTFGGLAVAGQRTVVLSTEELTPYTFVDGPRNYSPIVSSFIVRPYAFLSFEYRTDYDPLQKRFLDHTIDGSFRFSKYYVSVGQTSITTDPLLIPQSNQITFGGGYGSSNRRGWNVGTSVNYDLLLDRQTYEIIQGSYNSDCCGFAVQLRRINNFVRDENEYLFSFSVANLGTFGSMQKQDRIF